MIDAVDADAFVSMPWMPMCLYLVSLLVVLTRTVVTWTVVSNYCACHSWRSHTFMRWRSMSFFLLHVILPWWAGPALWLDHPRFTSWDNAREGVELIWGWKDGKKGQKAAIVRE